MIRLAFTSDLHTDSHTDNRRVWQEMVAILQDAPPDVFICCGDVAAEAQQFARTLWALESLSCPKLLVPGNHDVWILNQRWRQQGIGSQDKYHKLLPALCREAGFHPLWQAPLVIDDVAFCGSMGWYDYSLRNRDHDGHISREAYRDKRLAERSWNDSRFVHWLTPPGNGTVRRRLSDTALTALMVHELAEHLQQARRLASRIVAVTHMLPFRAMIRYDGDPQRDYFGAFMGSTLLGDLLLDVPAVEHVLSGHTHHKMTVQVGRITAHTSPLGYARQWRGRRPVDVARERLGFLDLV